jgi:hypothetical protein
MKSSQPVQLLTIEMRMDVDSSNPQDNRIFEVAWIDGKPNGRNTEADNLAEQLVLPPPRAASRRGHASRVNRSSSC